MNSESQRLRKKFETKLEARRAPKPAGSVAFKARAQEGPQRAFVETPADFAVYGGAAGGGKSFGLLLAAARDHDVRGADAVLFRREAVQLTGSGGLWSRSEELYPDLSGKPKQSPTLEWAFPSGMKVEFRHLHSEKDKLDYQGKEFAFVGFDELTHFTETQFWYIYSRVRTMSGVATRFRATTNPDSASWVRTMLSWWIDEKTGLAIPERSGVLRWFVRSREDTLIFADTPEELRAAHPDAGAPKSMTFIVASLADNAALEAKDPGYRDRLMMLPRVEREQLLGGNWNVCRRDGALFGPAATYDGEPPDGLAIGVGFDLAYTTSKKSDASCWLVLGKQKRTRVTPDGKTVDASIYYALDGHEARVAAPVFMERVRAMLVGFPIARRRFYVGGTEKGVSDFAATSGVNLGAVSASGKGDKYTRALPASEAWNEGRILVPKNAPWARAFTRQVEAFTGDDREDEFDDWIDALSAAFDSIGPNQTSSVTTGGGQRETRALGPRTAGARKLKW